MLQRQYKDTTTKITLNLEVALKYLQVLPQDMKPRVVNLSLNSRNMALIYTDAMYEPGQRPMMAFVLSSPRLKVPRVGWAAMSDETQAKLLPRKQQIGELDSK